MEILGTVQTKHILCENPSEIQSENNVVAKPLSPSHEETEPEKAENEAPSPTVHPDEQPSKSEAQTTGEQVNSWPNTTSSFKLRRKPFISIESPEWVPKGWITELRIRKGGYSAGNAYKLYYEPVKGRQFRSKNDVLSFLETGKRRRRIPKTTSEGKDGDETKDLSRTPSEFDSSASNIDGTSLEAGKRHKGRPKMNPEREIGGETKDLSGKASGFYASASNIGGIFPETKKLIERMPKLNSDGQFRNETKGLSRTTSGLYSGAVNNGGISPYGATCPSLVPSPFHSMLFPISGSSELLLHNNHTALPSNPFPIAPIVPQFIPTATPMSSFPNSVASQCATDPRMYPTCPILVSSPSCSMSSSITGNSDLLVHNNLTSLPSDPFPTVPIVPQSAPLISSFRDSVASQSTFASMMSDTMTKHLDGNSDLLVHSIHTAFPSNPFPFVPQSGTLISSFHDSVASQSTFGSMMSDTMTRHLAGTYDLLSRNKHTARLPSYPRPMFGFNPQLESVRFATQLESVRLTPELESVRSTTLLKAVNNASVSNASIPTALPSSRLHSSTILQSANSPHTISTGFDDLGKMPTKFQSPLEGAEGSKAHIFAEEKPTESSKKRRKPFIFTQEKSNGASKKERKPSLDLNL